MTREYLISWAGTLTEALIRTIKAFIVASVSVALTLQVSDHEYSFQGLELQTVGSIMSVIIVFLIFMEIIFRTTNFEAGILSGPNTTRIEEETKFLQIWIDHPQEVPRKVVTHHQKGGGPNGESFYYYSEMDTNELRTRSTFENAERSDGQTIINRRS